MIGIYQVSCFTMELSFFPSSTPKDSHSSHSTHMHLTISLKTGDNHSVVPHLLGGFLIYYPLLPRMNVIRFIIHYFLLLHLKFYHNIQGVRSPESSSIQPTNQINLSKYPMNRQFPNMHECPNKNSAKCS